MAHTPISEALNLADSKQTFAADRLPLALTCDLPKGHTHMPGSALHHCPLLFVESFLMSWIDRLHILCDKDAWASQQIPQKVARRESSHLCPIQDVLLLDKGTLAARNCQWWDANGETDWVNQNSHAKCLPNISRHMVRIHSLSSLWLGEGISLVQASELWAEVTYLTSLPKHYLLMSDPPELSATEIMFKRHQREFYREEIQTSRSSCCAWYVWWTFTISKNKTKHLSHFKPLILPGCLYYNKSWPAPTDTTWNIVMFPEVIPVSHETADIWIPANEQILINVNQTRIATNCAISYPVK